MSTPPARRSLADSFRPVAPEPDRAAALEGLLTPRPRLSAAASSGPTPAEGASDFVGRGSGRVVDISPEEERADVQGGAGPADPDKVRNVAAYLPVAVLSAFRQTSRSREMTYADLLVEAAAAHMTALESYFAVNAVPSGSGMPVRQTRSQPQPGVQVQIRLDGHQIAWLDEQVLRLGAPSRSALVVALLQAHLGVDG